jgi:hypothetical protein
VKRSYPKILSNRKRRIQRRMDPGHGWSDQAKPIMRASNIDDEMAEKARAVNCGGIGAIHLMVNKLGLRQEIESRLHLLKEHLPYHDSDHVLNLIYNALLEGVRFSSIKSDTFSLSPTAFDYTAEQIVSLANGRCNQENVIEQLKNGVNLMRMPVDDLLSNWACMVITSLAWNLKAWFGLLLPNSQQGLDLVKMEFRGFLHAILLLPAQIVHTGRRVVYRIMSYNQWLPGTATIRSSARTER